MASSRVECTGGDHDYCENVDGEGACCAKVTVIQQAPRGTHEKIDQSFYRCYSIDDIILSFENNDQLVDDYDGGNGNTYDFVCSKPSQDDSAQRYKVEALLGICFAYIMY